MEKKRDYSNKLNSLLASIQGKMVSIPISLVLAVGQMKTKSDESSLFVNSLIVVSSVIFSAIMLALLYSQWIALRSTKYETYEKWIRFEAQLSSKLLSEVRGSFEGLKKQCWLNVGMVCFLLFIVLVALGATLSAYVYLTPEVKEFFCLDSNHLFEAISEFLKRIFIIKTQ